MKKIAKFIKESTMDGRSYYDPTTLLFDNRELAEKARRRLIERTGQMFVRFSEIEEIEIYETESEIEAI